MLTLLNNEKPVNLDLLQMNYHVRCDKPSREITGTDKIFEFEI